MTNTCKISIQQFGPILEGTGDSFIDIPKCTCFIGPQGSGKSTVAKLIAEFSWLEKALVRGDVREKDLIKKGRFENRYCAYHRLSSYFRPETKIVYRGEYRDFIYEKGSFRVGNRDIRLFDLPKVLYIPAERNIVSVTDKTSIFKFLPRTLEAFWEEYDNARLNVKSEFPLPIAGITFSHDRLNKISWIKGEGFRCRLSDSASGFQSLIPLFLVSWYLNERINDETDKERMDPVVYDKLRQDIDRIMANPDLTEEVRMAALASVSSRFRYSHFINIVEEPELNLYPVSQRDLLQELVRFTNQREGNRLILTTHSPYILAALNNLLYAFQVSRKAHDAVAEIIPPFYWIDPTQVVAYSTEGGRVQSIMDPESLQIEAERIDGVSSELNTCYEQLLDLEIGVS